MLGTRSFFGCRIFGVDGVGDTYIYIMSYLGNLN